MARRSSVFTEEWRKCLGEHYKHVMESRDTATEKTLLPILERVGFTDDELRSLYIQATGKADEIPDLQKAVGPEALPQAAATFVTHPAECNCPTCMDVVLEEGHDAEGQPLDAAQRQEEQEKNTPRQQSLF